MLGLRIGLNSVSEFEGCLWEFFCMWAWFVLWDCFVGFSVEESWKAELNYLLFHWNCMKLQLSRVSCLEDHDSFNENWPSFMPATKPAEYHPASGWNILSWLFFSTLTGQGWFGSERVSQVMCSFFGSGPRLGRECQEFSHICNARRQWSPGTAGEFLNSGIFKRVKCRMESILFSSDLDCLSYVFVQLSHLKAQQIIF